MNESAPLVSIVIPLYNAEHYIEETLLSIVNQTYSNYEVIVVDNASTDSSLDIVNKIAEKLNNITVISCSSNSGGPAKPRNLGIEAANGKYVAFLDSDDVWYPDKLEKQVDIMNKSTCDFVGSRMTAVDDAGNVITSKLSILNALFGAKVKCCTLSNLMIRNNVITSSVLVRKSAIKQVRFNEADVFKCVEDYLFWLEVLSNNTGVYFVFPEALVKYRMATASLSNKDGKLKLLAKSIQVNYFAYISFNAPYKILSATLFNLLRIVRVSVLK
ncbi:glycosyltransferase family 2 protein [Vibrio cholerae]|uniref:Glycosyltransferase family 2 protein n=1 Tax=Vibrio cholerae TaxID=666 RepID=A0A7Z7YFT4_VIBCL|nr:glycosyltransferase family 2 protein [Vibrio cholerae]PNV71071.1 glycosyltransferase family 2 protein [Vibrio cholerae]TBM44717.1 glycosyltransferase family 2 protein [Vibrio cholerae]CQB50486.1 Glycosyltransferase [Vibrio cholerae]